MERFEGYDVGSNTSRLIARMRNFGLDDEVIFGWLTSPSAHLNGAMPVTLSESGNEEDVGRVNEACEAYLDGVPASEYFAERDTESSGGQIMQFPKRPDPIKLD